MKLNKKKKGFTIVELVIVIAVIGVLAAILIPTFTGLVHKAHQAADTSLVSYLNTALATDRVQTYKDENYKYQTMHEALEGAKRRGYDVAVIKATADGNEILWDSKNGVFCYLNDGNVEYVPNSVEDNKKLGSTDYNLWIIGSTVHETFSTYLKDYAGTEVTATKGLDVGNETNVTTVNYTHTEGAAQTVLIRTNSANTTLTINAPADTVDHHGSVGKVNVNNIDLNHCYNEYGTAAYIKLTEGKVVAKAGGKIEVIFAANNDKDAVAVIKETNGTIERGLTVIEPVSTTNEARINGIPLEYSVDGETAATKTAEQLATELETRETAVEVIAQEAVNTALENTEFCGVIVINNETKASKLMTLEAFRDSVNAGNAYAGYTVKLLDNIDLKDNDWIPIGNNDYPFSGVFDGQGFAISNFNVSLDSLDAGLFGVIRGIHSESMKTLYNHYWDATNSNLISGSDSDAPFGTIIKNLTLRSVDVSTTKDYAGALVGYAIDTYFYNINVVSGTVYAKNGKVGGVIGSSNGCSILNNLVTGTGLTVTGDKHTIAGIVGGVQRGYSNSDHKTVTVSNTDHTVLVENCTNNAHVVWDQNASHSGLGPIGGLIGNAGSATGLNVVVYKCTNNGNIDINSADDPIDAAYDLILDSNNATVTTNK